MSDGHGFLVLFALESSTLISTGGGGGILLVDIFLISPINPPCSFFAEASRRQIKNDFFVIAQVRRGVCCWYGTWPALAAEHGVAVLR